VTLPIDRAAIAALIPHAGAMCLLDGVLAWNRTSIACRASSHRATDNPLAADGRLDVVCGVEYAAQAMAVHGGLVGAGCQPGAGYYPGARCQPGAGRRPAAGYLASLRDVVCSVDRLDRLEGDLLVTAELLIADAGRVIYRFNVTCDDRPVLSGRAAVVIDAGTAA
jgi:predicted hotdog family 3-hydroxylacyl-ACP dehydratase